MEQLNIFFELSIKLWEPNQVNLRALNHYYTLNYKFINKNYYLITNRNPIVIHLFPFLIYKLFLILFAFNINILMLQIVHYGLELLVINSFILIYNLLYSCVLYGNIMLLPYNFSIYTNVLISYYIRMTCQEGEYNSQEI